MGNLYIQYAISLADLYIAYFSVSQPFLPRGTLGELYQYLAASPDAKICLKSVKVITGVTTDTTSRHPSVPLALYPG